jgi:hypothetical protein
MFRIKNIIHFDAHSWFSELVWSVLRVARAVTCEKEIMIAFQIIVFETLLACPWAVSCGWGGTSLGKVLSCRLVYSVFSVTFW